MSYLTDDYDKEVTRLLNNGGLGFMPSDTIYGLSGRALSESAVGRLHKIKDRRAHKPFIILISNLEMLDSLSINKALFKPFRQYWPGPLTFVLPAPAAPTWLSQGLDSLAVRMPANDKLRQLIDTVGPIISTSANIEGQPPAATVRQARAIFGEKLDFYIDIGEIRGPASTIVKVVNGNIEIIRQGAAKIKL